MNVKASVLLWFTGLIYLVLGETCLNAKPTSFTYSTTDSSINSHTVIIAQFRVQCSNSPKHLNLYAEVNDNIVAISRALKSDDYYQVSVVGHHDKLKSGTYNVRIYDEESFGSYRKAQRNNEDTSAIQPLFTVPVEHHGVWRGSYLQSETVAALASTFLLYFAFNLKTKIMSA